MLEYPRLYLMFSCDFQDLYRYLIDDYLVERGRKLRKKDFVVVTDFMIHLKMGKRIHLCEYETDSLADGLNNLFNRKVEIPRIRHGKRQRLNTLINEEALLLAKFLRKERKDWVTHEQVILTPDGQEVCLEITATAIRDENGEIVTASEMSLDITERKKTELAIKERCSGDHLSE